MSGTSGGADLVYSPAMSRFDLKRTSAAILMVISDHTAAALGQPLNLLTQKSCPIPHSYVLVCRTKIWSRYSALHGTAPGAGDHSRNSRTPVKAGGGSLDRSPPRTLVVCFNNDLGRPKSRSYLGSSRCCYSGRSTPRRPPLLLPLRHRKPHHGRLLYAPPYALQDARRRRGSVPREPRHGGPRLHGTRRRDHRRGQAHHRDQGLHKRAQRLLER